MTIKLTDNQILILSALNLLPRGQMISVQEIAIRCSLKDNQARPVLTALEKRGLVSLDSGEYALSAAGEAAYLEYRASIEAEEEAAYPLEDAAAAEATEDEDEDGDADPEVIRDYLKGHFAMTYMKLGGNEPRARCKTLRAMAAAWDGSRKEFVQAAVDNGIEAGTANANYQAGYKG